MNRRKLLTGLSTLGIVASFPIAYKAFAQPVFMHYIEGSTGPPTAMTPSEHRRFKVGDIMLNGNNLIRYAGEGKWQAYER